MFLFHFPFLLSALLPNSSLSWGFGLSQSFVTEILSHDDKHYLVFDQVGQMAASTTYLHVMLPLNLTTLHHQAQLLCEQLLPLTLVKTGDVNQIGLTRQMVDLGQSCLKRLDKSVKELTVLEKVLPQDKGSNRPTRALPAALLAVPLAAKTAIVVALIPIAIHGLTYGIRSAKSSRKLAKSSAGWEQHWKQVQAEQSFRLRLAFAEYNTTRFQLLGKINQALDTLPPHYAEVWDYDSFDVPLPPMDIDSYTQYDILRNHTDLLQQTLDDLTQQIFILRNLPLNSLPDPDLPVYRAPRDLDNPPKVYPLFDFLTVYLRLKPKVYPSRSARSVFEDQDQVDLFVPLRDKRWLPALGAVASIISAGARVVGTFMGLYNSAELAAITARVSSLKHTQDLLLHLSNRHTKQIQSLSDSLSVLSRNLVAFIAMNPGFLYVEINNHLVEFERKIVRATNVIQQLHHRRLAVNWLDDTQLNTLHLTVQEYAATQLFGTWKSGKK